MDEPKRVEFRYYEIPEGDVVFLLGGENWYKEYGEGREKLHFHNFYEVGICHAGEGEMILGEEEIPFTPGCISLIPTTELHTTNTFGAKAWWEWMYFDIYEVMKELYPDDEISRDTLLNQIQRQGRLLTPQMNIQKMSFLIRSIFSEMQNKEYLYRDMVHHLLLTLTVEIIRRVNHTGVPEHFTPSNDIFPAMDYIKKNYHTVIRISDLSSRCGMSENNFRSIFEKYMNMKPLDYVTFVRIQKGCSLLRNPERNVAEVSELVGYESVSSFIRNFRKIVGCTPHQWKVDEARGKNRFLNYHVTALKGWLE